MLCYWWLVDLCTLYMEDIAPLSVTAGNFESIINIHKKKMQVQLLVIQCDGWSLRKYIRGRFSRRIQKSFHLLYRNIKGVSFILQGDSSYFDSFICYGDRVFSKMNKVENALLNEAEDDFISDCLVITYQHRERDYKKHLRSVWSWKTKWNERGREILLEKNFLLETWVQTFILDFLLLFSFLKAADQLKSFPPYFLSISNTYV